MNNIAKELEEVIEIFRNEFSELDETITSIRISQDRWKIIVDRVDKPLKRSS